MLRKRGFSFKFDNMWFYATLDSGKLPAQGWKIHISVRPNELFQTIKIVSKLAIDHEYSFKVPIKWHVALKIAYGSYGNLMQGKEITIYPAFQEESELQSLCQILDDQIHTSSYCDIVTDIHYKSGNVFLRYGGFGKLARYDEYGKRVTQVIDYGGNKVDDLRLPYRYKPDWVTLPKFLTSSALTYEENILPNNITGIELLQKRVGTTVFTARYNGQEVILKLAMKNRMFDEAGRSNAYRLLHEARITKEVPESVNHPKIYETLDLSGNIFLVEDLIHGQTLEQLIRSREVGQNIWVIFIKIAQQIERLNDAGIAFRDLSPTNILIDEKGEPVLVDFELADHIGQVDAAQGGTPGYILPSQIRARVHRSMVDSDKYAFGALLFHALTTLSPIFEEEYYNNLSTLANKLRVLADDVHLDLKFEPLVDLSIKLMTEADLSWKEIVRFLKKSSVHDRRSKSDKIDNESGSTSINVEEQVRHYIRQQLRLIDAAYVYPKRSYTNFNSGPLGLIELMRYYDEINNTRIYVPSINKVLQKICSFISIRPDQAVHGFMNGDIYFVFINEYLKASNDLEETTTSKLTATVNDIVTSLDNSDLDSASTGLYYGVSGEGLMLSLAYMCSKDLKFQRTAIGLLNKIFQNIWSRRYTSYEGTVAFDIGKRAQFPQNESTNDLEYGIAGVGMFFLAHYLITKENTALHGAKAIFNTFYIEMKHDAQGTPFWYRTNNSTVHKMGLSAGDLGIASFIALFAIVYKSKKAEQLTKQLSYKFLINSPYLESPDIDSGIAGGLLFERLITTTHNKEKQTPSNLQRDLIDMATTRYNALSWSYANMYINNDHSFLYGNTGIYYGLISAAKSGGNDTNTKKGL